MSRQHACHDAAGTCPEHQPSTGHPPHLWTPDDGSTIYQCAGRRDPRTEVVEHPLVESLPSYIATCCREWDIAYGYAVGRCGLCGKRPKP